MKTTKMAVLLAGVTIGLGSACQSDTVTSNSVVSLSGPAKVSASGAPVVFVVEAFLNGRPGVGTVELSTTQGALSAPTVSLEGGRGAFELRCPGCVGTLTLTAAWADVTQSRDVKVIPTVDAGLPRADGGNADAGHADTDAGAVDSGRLDSGEAFDSGVSDAGAHDAGAHDAGVGSGHVGTCIAGDAAGVDFSLDVNRSLWWTCDGSVYTPLTDEIAPFDCEWDGGGAHPGYTYPDGGFPHRGCQGEPIDVVLAEGRSPTSIDICGTVELSEPMRDPVYPRASMITGPTGFSFKSVRFCCSRFHCLHDPMRIRYRISLEPGGSLYLGVGARTRFYGQSLFGLYEGTTTAPIPDDGNLDAGKLIVLDAGMGTSLHIDFGVGRGRRFGE